MCNVGDLVQNAEVSTIVSASWAPAWKWQSLQMAAIAVYDTPAWLEMCFDITNLFAEVLLSLS